MRPRVDLLSAGRYLQYLGVYCKCGFGSEFSSVSITIAEWKSRLVVVGSFAPATPTVFLCDLYLCCPKRSKRIKTGGKQKKDCRISMFHLRSDAEGRLKTDEHSLSLCRSFRKSTHRSFLSKEPQSSTIEERRGGVDRGDNICCRFIFGPRIFLLCESHPLLPNTTLKETVRSKVNIVEVCRNCVTEFKYQQGN
jgi:hypothetical protein